MLKNLRESTSAEIMRAIALLLILAAGAVGQGGLRKPLFGHNQYLMPADLTCKGYCPLEPKKGRNSRDSGIPGNCYSADNPGN